MAAGTQPQYSAFEILRTTIDDVLDTAYEREKCFGSFLEGLQICGITAGDFDRIIVGGHFPSASAYNGGQVTANTAELYATLSASDQASNPCQNGCNTIGSSNWPTTRRRKPGSLKSSGNAARLMPRVRASVSSEAWRMSLVRGPHEEA